MSHGKFGTAINCMDGRAQLPLIQWMKENYHLDYVDLITEPGADRVMAEGRDLEGIKAKALISVTAHGSEVLVIAGHYDCAGNPVTNEEHRAQLQKAVQVARSWDLPLRHLLACWMGEGWRVEPLDFSPR